MSDRQYLYDRMVIRPGTRCWVWTGASVGNGYCQITNDYSALNNKYVHRASWELHNGEIPAGMFVMHRCDNPRCINPEHLCVGTHADNMADMVRKNRQANGGDQGAAKLTDEDVKLIRAAPRGERMSLARKLGIDYTTFWLARTRKTWRHL
jgi:hypothetical protein